MSPICSMCGVVEHGQCADKSGGICYCVCVVDRARARIARLETALRGLLANEVYTYEGDLEANIRVSMDAVEAARQALAEETGK